MEADVHDMVLSERGTVGDLCLSFGVVFDKVEVAANLWDDVTGQRKEAVDQSPVKVLGLRSCFARVEVQGVNSWDVRVEGLKFLAGDDPEDGQELSSSDDLVEVPGRQWDQPR
mmetsp:Transcript_20856/g.32693  ORF Transcript_20856/g.32693 Transcript_20856/m.32693 type:complete len:113 (-) Transcript_20856:132-470(-)